MSCTLQLPLSLERSRPRRRMRHRLRRHIAALIARNDRISFLAGMAHGFAVSAPACVLAIATLRLAGVR